MKITKEAFQDLIQIEREAQIAKWGHQEHPDEKWGMILLEEAGEVAKAVLEKNDAALLQEMVQVAAVLEAWIISRNFFWKDEEGDPDEHIEIQRTDEKIHQHFVVLDEKFEVLLKGHIDEDRSVTLTFRHDAPETKVSEQYSSFDIVLNMIPTGVLPTIQFGDKETLGKFL